MKAFFGALVLTLASAAVGVFAAAGLHEITSAAAGGSSADDQAKAAASAPAQGAGIKQQVNYSMRPGVQRVPSAADGI